MIVKVIVTGPFNAGKTEFIKQISEIDPVKTEKKLTKSTKKEKTTVAMDFGRLTVDDELILHIYGTPGQRRFDFMWDILSYNMLGYVLLIDSCEMEHVSEAKQIMNFFSEHNVPRVIAANKQDRKDSHPVDAIEKRLNNGTVLPCVATEKESVKEVLLTLLYKVLEEAEE